MSRLVTIGHPGGGIDEWRRYAYLRRNDCRVNGRGLKTEDALVWMMTTR